MSHVPGRMVPRSQTLPQSTARHIAHYPTRPLSGVRCHAMDGLHGKPESSPSTHSRKSMISFHSPCELWTQKSGFAIRVSCRRQLQPSTGWTHQHRPLIAMRVVKICWSANAAHKTKDCTAGKRALGPAVFVVRALSPARTWFRMRWSLTSMTRAIIALTQGRFAGDSITIDRLRHLRDGKNLRCHR